MSEGDAALRNATGLVHGWTDVAVPRTRTGRSRLEHRHGWLDAVWQGATHFQKAQRFCVLAASPSE
jgi:hypothetical protein